jgi:hypothetical protein
MIKKKYYFYLVIAFITIFVAAIFTVYGRNMAGAAAAQIESNSTFTTCINGKCVTTTTICIINQPRHTVRSNSTNAANNNNNNSTDDNNNVITTPFSHETI